jgi:hypothetical protein
MNSLPADIEVLEPAAGAFRERRFRLPTRTHAAVRQNYRDALIGAAAICLVPIAFATLFAVGGYFKNGDVFEVAGFAVAFFGSFLFPMAAILVIAAVIHRWSRIELTASADRLVLRSWLGPFFRTRQVRLAGMKGLRVQIGRLQIATMRGSAPFDPKSILCDVGTLYADFEKSPQQMICSGYDADWLLNLANELTRAIEANQSSLWPVTVTHEDPRIISERAEQPSTSDARVSSTADRVVIEHPARGWRRAWPAWFVVGYLFATGMLIVWTIALLNGQLLIRESRDDGELFPFPVWLGLLVAAPCYAVAICVAGAWIGAARNSARWEITPHQLCLWQRTLWGESVAIWSRAELRSIRAISQLVGEFEYNRYNCLQITSTMQPLREFFRERDKSEIEWLATTLSAAMGLASTNGSKTGLIDPQKLRETSDF